MYVLFLEKALMMNNYTKHVFWALWLTPNIQNLEKFSKNWAIFGLVDEQGTEAKFKIDFRHLMKHEMHYLSPAISFCPKALTITFRLAATLSFRPLYPFNCQLFEIGDHCAHQMSFAKKAQDCYCWRQMNLRAINNGYLDFFSPFLPIAFL